MLAYSYLLFVVLSLTLVSKLISLKIPFTAHSLTITGATFIMPVAFFIQNLITENYGYVKSRRLVQMSIPFIVIYIFTLKTISNLPSPIGSNLEAINNSYPIVFNALPKHLYGLLVTIFICSLANDYLISKSKILFSGRYLGVRFIVAVIFGEAFSHIVSILVWLGTLDFYHEILPLVAFSYSYKILFEVAATPFNYIVSNYLKNNQGADAYDNGVKYNPFIWK